MPITKARAVALVLAGFSGAALTVVAVAVRIAGWPATRNQLAKIMFDAESVAWPVISRAGFVLSPRSTAAEEDVWKFVIGEYARGPHEQVVPIAINPVAEWQKSAVESPRELSHRITEGWSRQQRGNPEAATSLQDFLIKATKPATIAVTLPPRSRFMSYTEFERHFKDRNDGWNTFHRDSAGAVGYLSLSRVGFNLVGNRALIYVEFSCGWLCGHGVYYILEKRSGKWERTAEQIRWVS
ncbi:MAG: hypothetical protein QOC81_947 [Thermoanaerobaculia bacterium]|jgi:hypothetical protein|nr:hypothetical protein [Thermoanaerobaculia bacterium]